MDCPKLDLKSESKRLSPSRQTACFPGENLALPPVFFILETWCLYPGWLGTIPNPSLLSCTDQGEMCTQDSFPGLCSSINLIVITYHILGFLLPPSLHGQCSKALFHQQSVLASMSERMSKIKWLLSRKLMSEFHELCE